MKSFLMILSLTTMLLVQATSLAADIDADAVIKYRKDFMTAVKGHNNDIKAIVNGDVPFTQHLPMHLNALEQLFAEIGVLFPEGSDFGETNAKEAIWENPDKFAKTVEDSKAALATFKQVVDQGDMNAARGAFKKFGRDSCGSCHKSFKKKDN